MKVFITKLDENGDVMSYGSPITGPSVPGGIRHQFLDTDVNRVQLV